MGQVSREQREARGEAPKEESFVYGRQENRREGESYVDQVSREKKGDTAPPPAASSSQGVYTEDRPQDQAAAEQQSNYVGNRRMGDYGRRENRRDGESHSDQVTREYGEDRDERRRQREDRQAQRDRFDPMSRRRQRGESREEYRERKEKIESFDQKAQEALRNGDTTLLGKGYVPVLFTRADQQRKVLLRVDVSHSTVVEGAQGNERIGSLPSEDAYYLGGGGGIPAHPWKISIRAQPNSDPPVYQYNIEANSKLYNGVLGDNISVSGLGTWQALGDSDTNIFIDVDISENIVSNASVEKTANLGSLIIGNPQTRLKVPLGYIWFVDDAPNLRQDVWHHLTLIDACRQGFPVKTYIAT